MIKTIVSLTCILSTFLTAQTIQVGTLEVKTVHPKLIDKVPLGVYLGTYEYPLHNRYTISANVDGFITKINIKPFEKVVKGEKLFSLTSPKLLDLQAKYINNILEKEYLEKEVARLTPLVKKGAVANKKLIESLNKLQKFKSTISFEEDVLLAHGMSEKQIKYIKSKHKPDPTLSIFAPQTGSISSLNITSGSFVTQGSVLAKLLNTSECHFSINMNWKEADTLKVGEKVFSDSEEFAVFARSPQIDTISQTRSIDLHQEGNCDAKGGVSRNIAFYREHKAYVISDNALITLNDKYVLFKKTSDGFELVEVKLLGSSNGLSYIEAALSSDDFIAVSSVLTLKTIAQEKDE
ncbi:MAG: efflux RND transporter periplasmic adaptor subunit [Sulfurimonas sp.]|nr:efflux RND transporter periplasmic adaptor subunit [Sulfurimonas sp.]